MIHVLSYLPGSGDDCLPSVSYLNQGLLIPAFSITTRKRPLNIKHRFTPMPQQMSSFTWRTIHITFCHERLTVACDDVKSVTFILFLNRKDSQATRTSVWWRAGSVCSCVQTERNSYLLFKSFMQLTCLTRKRVDMRLRFKGSDITKNNNFI